jgi:hypothetical protein
VEASYEHGTQPKDSIKNVIIFVSKLVTVSFSRGSQNREVISLAVRVNLNR